MQKIKNEKPFELENNQGSYQNFAKHLSAKHENLQLPKGNLMILTEEEDSALNQGESYKQNPFGVFTNGEGQENWIGRYNELLKMFS